MRRTIPNLTLAELPDGGSGWILSLDLSEQASWKLMEMGFGLGRKITVVRRAPLGDPLEVEVLGYRLAIRMNEARGVRVRRTRP